MFNLGAQRLTQRKMLQPKMSCQEFGLGPFPTTGWSEN